MKRFALSLSRCACLALALLSASCTGSGAGPGVFDGNPATRPTPGNTEVGWGVATSLSLPAPDGGSLLLGLGIEEGLIEIDEVRFLISDLQLINASNNPQFTVPGPFVARLIQGGVIVDETLPEVGGVVVQNGTYAEFDQSFAVLTNENLPGAAAGDPVVTGPMIGHSMIIEGSFDGTPFRFLSEQDSEIRVETPNAFTLTGDFVVLFIASQIEAWFDGVIDDLQSLDPEILASELVLLNTQSLNPDLQDIALQIETNINQSFRFAISLDFDFEESQIDEDSSSDVFNDSTRNR